MNESLMSMFMSLAPFNRTELEKATDLFKSEKLNRNDFFNKAGRVSDKIGFVSNGLLRSFYSLKEKEATTFFLTEGSVAVALRSIVEINPAIENIQAVQDSELIVIKRENLYDLYRENWKWQQVGRRVIENSYIEMEQRSISLQILSAQERYVQFLAKFPEVIKVVPLHQIASYLGISPETLSRIRRSI
jgi:CRP-like cAMP-binding protein